MLLTIRRVIRTAGVALLSLSSLIGYPTYGSSSGKASRSNSNYECEIDFNHEVNTAGLERVSKKSIYSVIAIEWKSDHYDVTYGNGSYVFVADDFEDETDLLRLSHYEDIAGIRQLVWVLEIYKNGLTEPRFGLIYGESPWADLRCNTTSVELFVESPVSL